MGKRDRRISDSGNEEALPGRITYIIEDFYKSRPTRIYEESSPTIRSERLGLVAVMIEKGEKKDDTRRQ